MFPPRRAGRMKEEKGAADEDPAMCTELQRGPGSGCSRAKKSTPCSRLLKKGHLRRWSASPLAATYLQYVSLGLRHSALHMSFFEQPDQG